MAREIMSARTRAHAADTNPLPPTRALRWRCAARVISSHDVKQRRLLRSRGAFVRPGGVLVIASTPIEGRAERRQAHLF